MQGWTTFLSGVQVLATPTCHHQLHSKVISRVLIYTDQKRSTGKIIIKNNIADGLTKQMKYFWPGCVFWLLIKLLAEQADLWPMPQKGMFIQVPYVKVRCSIWSIMGEILKTGWRFWWNCWQISRKRAIQSFSNLINTWTKINYIMFNALIRKGEENNKCCMLKTNCD